MDMPSTVASLSALAQPTRLRVVELLAKLSPDAITAGEIGRLIDTPQNTMSAHLAVLSRAGLVASDRRGREVLYRVNADTLRKLTVYLAGLTGTSK
jgi:ArsR family transcriptional regulator, arsenate/arsenite/antimonite-responsive transcriptional repressor